MWIVRLALNRPHTFLVLALVILLVSPVMISRTPADIFPRIDIPVIAVVWTYTGLNAEELEGRVSTIHERSLTNLVNDVEHTESTTLNGTSLIKIFLQPYADIRTALSQTIASSQSVLRQLPPGIQPPLIVTYSASSAPVLQLGLSGAGISEQQLYDIGTNFLRPQLITVPGAMVPNAYGGKQRQIMIDLQPSLLQPTGLSASDVVSAVAQQNLILPSGTAKIGPLEYDVTLNASPRSVAEFNDLPIRVVGTTPIRLGDVANVRDGFSPQTNVVRLDGRRGALMSVLKTGDASTIDVVAGIRKMLPRVVTTLPPELQVRPVADQSRFVKAAVDGVVHEAIVAACLTGVMILLFLGSWRSTLIIAVSIPLSILTSLIVLSLIGETINLMTLGGLALAVGILVDDATVTIENIERHLADGQDLRTAIQVGAAEIAVPTLVSTLCICIVFLPMAFLTGVSRYLFVPLAEAVVFAMLASYVLSRTLVPTLALMMLRPHVHGAAGATSRNPLVRFQAAFERGFERVRVSFRSALSSIVASRRVFIPAFLAASLAALLLTPWLGQDFFPVSDSGQFLLHLRAKTGTRIEETARLCDRVEELIARVVPPHELDSVLDNIGMPYSAYNYAYNRSGLIGPGDADVYVSLKPGHGPTADYVRELRRRLPQEFPGTTFDFLPADIVTQTLNFGLPAPIDVQIDGPAVAQNRALAEKMMQELRRVPGLVDLRIQQRFDAPRLRIDVDRTRAALSGFTQRDVANSLLISLSGSGQTAPAFFLNPQNGVSYSVTAQTPQHRLQSLPQLQNIALTAPSGESKGILADVAEIERAGGMAVVSHYNIRRVVDIFASVQDRDLGAVGRDVQQIVDKYRPSLPRGSFMSVRGQLTTMQASYTGLLAGLGFAVVLVYLLIVVNFQSWLDPLIIMMSTPGALAGIVLLLFFTGTTLSVPALMGAIMCIGVATANSILVISFAKDRFAVHGNAARAAVEAGFARFRPVLMTAIAMIVGMVPMALGAGEGGEQNAPLGRAVIGGLLVATVASLVFVPAVFSALHRSRAPERALTRE